MLADSFSCQLPQLTKQSISNISQKFIKDYQVNGNSLNGSRTIIIIIIIVSSISNKKGQTLDKKLAPFVYQIFAINKSITV